MFHEHYERVVQWATSDAFREQVLKGRAEFFAATGEVFEDDRSYEPRMSAFLDYYLLDRAVDGKGKAPARLFVESHTAQLTTPELNIYRGFLRSRHALFEVRKLDEAKGLVRVRDLFTGKDEDVTERRKLAGVEKGDVVEARLLPFGDRLFFTPAFVFHPREARKLILKEIKRRKNADAALLDRAFIWLTARMALKVERYRKMPVETLYDFEREKQVALPPRAAGSVQ
jgi:hypothetical protein